MKFNMILSVVKQISFSLQTIILQNALAAVPCNDKLVDLHSVGT
jgi:hypothetical protein